MTIAAYYGKLKMLWDELANYEQIPLCSYGGCKCGITSKLEKRREEERVHQFLMGLEDAVYGTMRSNLLAVDPLPSLNSLFHHDTGRVSQNYHKGQRRARRGDGTSGSSW